MSADHQAHPTEDSLIQPSPPDAGAPRRRGGPVLRDRHVRGRQEPGRQPAPPAGAPAGAPAPERGASPAESLDGTDGPAPDSPEAGRGRAGPGPTVISAIRQDWAPYPTWPLRRFAAPDWAWPLYPLFFVYRSFEAFHGKLRDLRFIHYAHWAVIKRIAGKDGAPERLRYKYLLFEVNFDGLMEQYVDGLTRLPWRRGWTPSGGSGAALSASGHAPMPGFKRYIERNAYRPDYYWSAYPDATTTMVHSACTLRKRCETSRKQRRTTP